MFDHYGEDKHIYLDHMIKFLNELHRIIDHEAFKGNLLVLIAMAEYDFIIEENTTTVNIHTIDDLIHEVTETCLIRITITGEIIVCKGECTLQEDDYESCLIYKYSKADELFFLGADKTAQIISPYGSPSFFARPTFTDLRTALDDYKRTVVRASNCPTLKNIWTNPDSRIFLVNKPEHLMRDSLHYFLDNRLRDAEVRREQVVDDSHPVDIKVTWSLEKKHGLIEVKWLGKSLNSEGTAISTPYSDQRAKDGARQLADYMDANYVSVSDYVAKGYLIVIDARRRGATSIDQVTINRDDGFHYKDREIVYDPAFHEQRTDFEEPIRMFAEPKCQS